MSEFSKQNPAAKHAPANRSAPTPSWLPQRTGRPRSKAKNENRSALADRSAGVPPASTTQTKSAHNKKQTRPLATTLATIVLFLFLLPLSPIQASQVQQKTKKLVSLAPSNTELVYSLGASDNLAAVSSYCAYPKAAATKPVAGSFILAKYETLAKLKPDMVLLVSGQEILESQLKRHGYKTLFLRNDKLKDIGTNLSTLGQLCDKRSKAELLRQAFERSTQELSDLFSAEKKPKVLLCVWPNPYICAGQQSFLSDVIIKCGGINATSQMDGSYPKLSAERIIALAPDIVIFPYEARDGHLVKRPPWSTLMAIKAKRFYYLPDQDNDMLAKPTLRVLKGMYWLSLLIHPDKKVELKDWMKRSQTALSSIK